MCITQVVPKNVPAIILYVSDNLINAHLHRLPHRIPLQHFFIGFKFT